MKQMKKHWKVFSISGIAVIIMIVLFVFINTQKDKQKLSESLFCNRTDIIDSNDIKIVVDKDIYQSSDDEISFYLLNNSEEMYMYGEAYYIEMLNKNGWNYVIPDSGVQFVDLVLNMLSANHKSENYSIPLKGQYSHLQSGTYRIYKEVTDENHNTYVIYAEFQVG